MFFDSGSLYPVCSCNVAVYTFGLVVDTFIAMNILS